MSCALHTAAGLPALTAHIVPSANIGPALEAPIQSASLREMAPNCKSGGSLRLHIGARRGMIALT